MGHDPSCETMSETAAVHTAFTAYRECGNTPKADPSISCQMRHGHSGWHCGPRGLMWSQEAPASPGAPQSPLPPREPREDCKACGSVALALQDEITKRQRAVERVRERLVEKRELFAHYMDHASKMLAIEDCHGAWDASCNASEASCEVDGLLFALEAMGEKETP